MVIAILHKYRSRIRPPEDSSGRVTRRKWNFLNYDWGFDLSSHLFEEPPKMDPLNSSV